MTTAPDNNFFFLATTAFSLALAGATLLHQLVVGDAGSAPAGLAKFKQSVSAIAGLYTRQEHRFLVGFSLMALGDWLQGPYLFSMYDSAGVPRTAQLDLYAFDFFLGAILSVCVGVASDLGGRKMSCVVYGILYGLSCLCNHFPSHFAILATGCAVDGLCNALLRCAFESYWSESAKRTLRLRDMKMNNNNKKKKKKQDQHEKRDGDDDDDDGQQEEEQESWIGHTLALAQWWSTVCSLVAGLACYGCVSIVGEYLKDTDHGGGGGGASENFKYLATMDLAALVLFSGSAYIALFWEADAAATGSSNATEKKTQQQHQQQEGGGGGGLFSTVWKALRSLPVDTPGRLCLFLLEVSAEAALLLFICLYPALLHNSAAVGGGGSSSSVSLPFGFVFTQLMAALAVGSYWYGLAMARNSGESNNSNSNNNNNNNNNNLFVLKALCWSSFACAIAILVLTVIASGTTTMYYGTVVVAVASMWVFELAIGVYLSALGGLHERLLDDDVRASSVGICRMLSYLLAWIAVQHQFWTTKSDMTMMMMIPAPLSVIVSSAPVPAEFVAWLFCAAASVCFFVFSVGALVFHKERGEKKTKVD